MFATIKRVDSVLGYWVARATASGLGIVARLLPSCLSEFSDLYRSEEFQQFVCRAGEELGYFGGQYHMTFNTSTWNNHVEGAMKVVVKVFTKEHVPPLVQPDPPWRFIHASPTKLHQNLDVTSEIQASINSLLHR